MTITAKERAVNAVGENGYRRLLDAGLVIGYQRTEKRISYAVGEKEILGTVRNLEDNEPYPYVDRDENGFEIVYASSHCRIFVDWIADQNCVVIE